MLMQSILPCPYGGMISAMSCVIVCLMLSHMLCHMSCHMCLFQWSTTLREVSLKHPDKAMKTYLDKIIEYVWKNCPLIDYQL